MSTTADQADRPVGYGPVRAARRVLRMEPARRRLALRCGWQLTVASWQVRRHRDRIVPLIGAPEPAGTAIPEIDLSPEDLRHARSVGRLVIRWAQLLPWHPTCLRQALATRRVLEHDGIPSRISLGVRPGSELTAHAWVTVGGIIVNGAAGRTDHVEVAVFDALPDRRSHPVTPEGRAR